MSDAITELIERTLRFDVKNNSSETIPPFGCMELDYAFDSGKRALEIVGSSLICHVKKPTANYLGNPERFLINGPMPIPPSGFGSGYKMPILQALLDVSVLPSAGDACGPTSGSWLLSTAGSGWIIKSLDAGPAYESGNTKSVFVELVSSSASLAYFYPPASGIPAATFNSITKRLTPGKASCKRAIRYSATEYTEGTGSEVVENIVSSIVATSEWPFAAAKNEYGTWTIVVENCASSSGGGQIGDQQTDPTPDPSPEI